MSVRAAAVGEQADRERERERERERYATQEASLNFDKIRNAYTRNFERLKGTRSDPEENRENRGGPGSYFQANLPPPLYLFIAYASSPLELVRSSLLCISRKRPLGSGYPLDIQRRRLSSELRIGKPKGRRDSTRRWLARF